MYPWNDFDFACFTLYQLFGPDLNKIKTFRNEEEAFRYVWNKTSTLRTSLSSTKQEKVDTAAEWYKSLGNDCYTSKAYKEAEKSYLIGLCYANYAGVIYGKILSNLALLRYTQGKYQQCIEIINMCEKTEYPKNNFPKLLFRKMWALKKIGDDRNAVETFGQLKQLLSELKLNESEQKKILDEANEVLKELPDNKLNMEELIVPEMEGDLTPKAEIRKGGVRETIVQAKEHIKLGETILVEQILVTNIVKFCSNCNSPNEVPHPCESCIFALYCSDNCKKADAETHKLQCTLYQMKSFLKVSVFIRVPLIAFTKGLTLNAYHDFKAFSKDLDTFVDTLLGCSVVVHHIMNNRQILKTLVSKNLVRSGLDAEKTACEIGKKLLELAVILKFNRELFYKETYENYSFFPKYISFGHSCVPNTSKYLSGNKIVLKAAENIQAGQEITVAYGNLLYTNLKHAQRQEELQTHYGFKCQCRACKDTYLETQLNGVILCECCGFFYMRLKQSSIVVCDNCSFRTRLDPEIRKVAIFLETQGLLPEGELVKTIERFKELKINPSNNTLVVMQWTLAIYEMDQGNIENAMKIVPKSNVFQGHFNKYIYCHHALFRSLQTYLKTLHLSASLHFITEKINIETVYFLKKFLNAFESLLNLYYPKRKLLEGIEEVRKYVSIIEQIYATYSEAFKLDWNIVDKDYELRKTVKMPSY